MKSKHLTEILIFSLLCLYKNIPPAESSFLKLEGILENGSGGWGNCYTMNCMHSMTKRFHCQI